MPSWSDSDSMDPKLPTDDDTNHLFDQIAAHLNEYLMYSYSDAVALAREYYACFCDTEYCSKLHIPVQDDEFFHHESAGEMALRVHYYLGLRLDADPHKYIEWRTEYYRRLRKANER